MSAERTIGELLAAAAVVAEREAARDAWVRKTAAALKKAQREMDRVCDNAVGRLSEEEFRRLFKAEQAKVCAFLDRSSRNRLRLSKTKRRPVLRRVGVQVVHPFR